MWDDDRDDALDEARERDQRGATDAGPYCAAHNVFWDAKVERPRKVIQHAVYYLENRDPRKDGPVEDATRELFTATTGDVTRAESRTLLWANRSGKGKLMHRLVMSPSKGLGIRGLDDMQAWVRTCMADYATHLDRDIQWVAAIHSNTEHPHAHILIGGEAAAICKEGVRVGVRFGPGDFKVLREIGVRRAASFRAAARGRDLAAAREHQAARMADLDRRLGVVDLPLQTPIDTPPTPLPAPVPPAPQAARKRGWFQRWRAG